MSRPPLHVLLIGICSELHGLQASGGSPRFPGTHDARFCIHKDNRLDGALGRIERQGLQPDVIVLGVQWPGHIEAGALDWLARFAPLARVVYSVGCWCQGISATKQLSESLPRFPEPIGDVRLRRELDELARGNTGCSIVRPVTATFDERLDAGVAGFECNSDASVETGVVSSDPLFRDWLCEALKTRGETACPRESPEDLGGRLGRIVWDLTPWTDATPGRVREFIRRYPETLVLAVLAFPRPRQRRELHEAGVAALLAKPLLLADLFWLLDGLKARESQDAVVAV